MVDITKMVAPKTDQLNADDFIGKAPFTVKINGVKDTGNKEQPLAISFEGDNGKPWKPGLAMRRVLIQIWGDEVCAAAEKHFPGRAVTLYRDPDVKFGGMTVGGVRVSHASNITSEMKCTMTVSKGKRVEFIVKPLRVSAAPKSEHKTAPPADNAPAPETTTTEKPPHVKTALKMLEAIKECETVEALAAYWNDKLTQDELAIVDLAKAETADHVKTKYAERLAELSIPQ